MMKIGIEIIQMKNSIKCLARKIEKYLIIRVKQKIIFGRTISCQKRR
jgi:hypothetical protein